jgi:hypothetical protein
MMQIRKKSNRLVQPKTMPLQFGIWSISTRTTNTNYCVRVTANDGDRRILREFQDTRSLFQRSNLSEALTVQMHANNVNARTMN